MALVKYADDIRFPDKKEQEKEYSGIDGDITETKIAEIEQVSDNEYKATVEIVSDGKLYEPTFPVRKQKKGWKIIVGQDL